MKPLGKLNYMSHRLYLIIILNIILLGCSINNNAFSSNHTFPYENYTKSQKQLKQGNYKQAINILENLYKKYSFSDCYEQIQLDLIFAYYKNTDFALAKSLIKKFIHRYPKSINIDYIFYIKGLVNMSINGSKIQKFLKIDLFDRDVNSTQEAFNDFSKIILSYKNSKYLLDAKKKLIFLKDVLAKYNFEVIKFYLKKKYYISVINRVHYMLENYPNEKETFMAFHLMKLSYKKLFLFIEKDKIIYFNKIKNQ